VRDSDKKEIADTAKRFHELGFTIYATAGTVKVLNDAGIPSVTVNKIHESDSNAISLIESGKIHYVISTSSKGRLPSRTASS
jgi:carbamoyl-phosphate synthase large subunit